MHKTARKTVRKIKHSFLRSKIDKARADRMKVLYSKTDRGWQAMIAKYEAAVEELKKPNPNSRMVNHAETLVRQTISDAEKTVHHINRIKANKTKPGALSGKFDASSFRNLSIMLKCTKGCLEEAKECLAMLKKMKKKG